MSFSDRLKSAIDHGKFEPKLLAEKIGMSQTAMQAILGGKAERSAYTVDIAVECHVDPVWLATGAGKMVSKSTRLSSSGDSESEDDDESAWVELILKWIFDIQDELGLEFPPHIQAGWLKLSFQKFRRKPIPEKNATEEIKKFKLEAKALLKLVK